MKSQKQPLLRLSLEIAPEVEEPVSALLETVFGQAPSIYFDLEAQTTTATLYFTQRSDWTPARRQRVEQGLEIIAQCGLDVGSGRITTRTVKREDWAESWKRHFKAQEIGRHLLIKPSWIKRRPKAGQAVVVLDPGLSFGTGQHATTSFCLHQLVDCRQKEQRQSFLDIGTGSGILAIAALKLGYQPVQAFDFDPESVRVARENAAANDVALRPTRQDLTKVPLKSTRQFDVLCANLMYDLLLQEQARILYRLKPDGHLILAGILQSQFSQVKKAYEKAGLKLVATQVEKEWQSGRFIWKKPASGRVAN